MKTINTKNYDEVCRELGFIPEVKFVTRKGRTMTNTELKIRKQKTDDAMYCRYAHQSNRQPCFLELDCDTGELRSDYNAEIGGAIPFTVYHRRTLRFYVDAPLRAETANALMESIGPLCQTILDGYDTHWDGHNMVGKFTSNAEDAIEFVRHEIESNEPWHEAQTWEVWDAGDWFGGEGSRATRQRYGITPLTTDDELAAAVELAKLQEEVPLEGTLYHFRQLRQHALEDYEEIGDWGYSDMGGTWYAHPDKAEAVHAAYDAMREDDLGPDCDKAIIEAGGIFIRK